MTQCPQLMRRSKLRGNSSTRLQEAIWVEMSD